MNQLTILEPRQAPMSVEDFNKLEAWIDKSFTVKPITEGRSVPVKDDNGIIYRWEHDVFETGLSLTPQGTVDPKVIDAMKRPATSKTIAYHLTRLSAHKRNTKGGFAFQVIVEDVTKDLEGVSEWAVIKAYEKLRKAEGDFFPSANEIVKAVNVYEDAIKMLGQKNENKPIAMIEEKPLVKGKAKVAEILHNANIAHDKEYCEQCKEQK